MFKITAVSAVHKRMKYWKIPVITLGITVLLVTTANVNHTSLLDAMNIKVFFGFFLSQIALLLYSQRFRLVMKSTGIVLGSIEALRINTLAVFYQFFVPLSVGADLTKFIKLKRSHNSPGRRVGSIILDHVVGICALVTLSIFLLVIRKPTFEQLNFENYESFIALTIFSILVLSIIYQPTITKYTKKVLSEVKEKWPLIFMAFCFSIIMHITLAAGVFIGSQGVGLNVPYLDILFVLSVSMIVQSIPISLLGVGAPEIAGTAMYTAIGLSIPVALLLVALLYSYRLITSVIGGLWELLDSSTQLLPSNAAQDTIDQS